MQHPEEPSGLLPPGCAPSIRSVALAGHTGDEATARRGLASSLPSVRAAALGALSRLGRLGASELAEALADGDSAVRRRACELAPTFPVDLVPALSDPDPLVVEAAAWALGERGDQTAAPALAHVSRGHSDPLCREAAIAALGAIGDPVGLPAILAALDDRPPIRRRAVLALAPFQGDAVEAALHKAAGDRDWQVRQGAQDLLDAGRDAEGDVSGDPPR